MQIILASASPRRKELLGQIAEDFKIIPANINEDRKEGEDPKTYVKRLSLEKADAIAVNHSEGLVIGADTTVAYADRVFNKPKDKAQAREFLQLLSGKVHTVCSAYSIICLAKNISVTRISVTEVEFIDIPADLLEEYLESDEPYDKAGAYAIQGDASKFVKSMSGSYTGVIGLDIKMLEADLNDIYSV